MTFSGNFSFSRVCAELFFLNFSGIHEKNLYSQYVGCRAVSVRSIVFKMLFRSTQFSLIYDIPVTLKGVLQSPTIFVRFFTLISPAMLSIFSLQILCLFAFVRRVQI